MSNICFSSMLRHLCIFVSLSFSLCVHGQVENSVLRSGSWYKLGVLEKGIYKIDGSYLESIGIDVNNVDPRKLAIYGNGGNGMLPQSNSEPRADDLNENAILVSGEDDGSFDIEDYILFYGNSPDLVEYNPADGSFIYENNLYIDTTFYFLTLKDTPGLRIGERESLESALNIISTFRNVLVHEVDESAFDEVAIL